MTTGTIKKIELEGGFYGIITEDGEQLFPLNLPVEHRTDGLRLRFEYQEKSMFTTQMWGRKVILDQIEVLAD